MQRLSPTAPSRSALPTAKLLQTPPRKAFAALCGSTAPGAAEAPVVRVFHDDEDGAVEPGATSPQLLRYAPRAACALDRRD